MTTIDEQLQANIQQFQEGLQRIESLTEEVPAVGLSVPVDEEVKRQLRRDLFDIHQREYERLADLKRQEVQTNMDQARQRLFRTTPNLTESHAEVTMSVRDAQDRLRGVTNPAELSARLRDAVELNDRVMTRQVLRSAVDVLGDVGQAGANIVREYLSYFPSEEANYHLLEDAAQAQQRLEEYGVGFSPMNPEAPTFAFGRGAGPTDTPLTHHPTTHDSGPGGSVIPDSIVSRVQPEAGDGGE
jgi:hypothetical protein